LEVVAAAVLQEVLVAPAEAEAVADILEYFLLL
jgi:hypothetical protein